MTAKDLKNALLQEAVQGRLVPQIASEGNARDLLEEIRKEKLSHGLDFANAKSGKRKSKKETALAGSNPCDITEDEIPFDIPESWCWCRLGEVTEIARGGSPRPIKDYLTTDESGYNWIKIGDTDKNGKYINQTAEKIVKEGLSKTRLVHKGDFLLTNSMSFGRPYILNIDGCIHDGWLVISPKGTVFNKDFLYYVLSSTFAYNQFCDSVSGAVVKNLNSDKVRESLLPLPPLAEQKRIVAAIEKFMPLIEEYGKKETQLKAINEKIGTLTKKAILQEAVQGKLVPQIAAEGNAKDLLEEIKKEKAKLIKEGKIKKEKPLPEISEDEIPFDIPENWCYIRPTDIGYFSSGKTPKLNEITNEGYIPYFKVSDMNNKGNELYMTTVIHYLTNNSKYKLFPKNSIIYPKNGGAVFTNKKRILITDSLVDLNTGVFIPIEGIYIKYFYLLFSSIDFKQYYKGTALPTIDLEAVQKIVWALPPLAEQKRIVATIEKMLPLCEKLGE